MVYIMVYVYIYCPSANTQETFVMEIGVPETLKLCIPTVYCHFNRYNNKYWVLKDSFRQTRMNLK